MTREEIFEKTNSIFDDTKWFLPHVLREVLIDYCIGIPFIDLPKNLNLRGTDWGNERIALWGEGAVAYYEAICGVRFESGV